MVVRRRSPRRGRGAWNFWTAVCAPALLAGRARATVDKTFDPKAWTCLVPIREDQSLKESAVWTVFIGEIHGKVKADTEKVANSVSQAASALPGKSVAGERGAVASTGSEQVDHERHSAEGVVQDAEASVKEKHLDLKLHKRVKDIDTLLKSVNQQVLTACEEGEFQKRANEAVRDVTKVPKDWKEHLQKKTPCWDECKKAGECAFCGEGGVCCQVAEPGTNGTCPWLAGCVGKHCCDHGLSKTALDPSKSCKDTPPGEFCLASMLDEGDQKYVSTVQLCSLRKTDMQCPPGLYCRGGGEPPRACPQGKRCPMRTSEPQPCPEGYVCPIAMMQKRCKDGWLCNVNQSKPAFCPAGSYCLRGKQHQCPGGHFCAFGSGAPAVCPSGAACEAESSFPSWDHVAVPTLVFWLVMWFTTISAVPAWIQGKETFWASVPAVVPCSLLALMWVCWLDLPYGLAQLCRLPSAELLSMRSIFVGTGPSNSDVPHTEVIVFMSMMSAFLFYGCFVRARLPRTVDTTFLDFVVAAVLICSFACILHDLASFVFLWSLFAEFKVAWIIVAKQGSWNFRVSVLGCGLLALVVAFLCTGMYELAAALVLSVFALACKECLLGWLPQATLFTRRRRVEAAESVLSNTPLRLSDTLLSLSEDVNRVQDLVLAAQITLGARESLEARREQADADVQVAQLLQKALDAEAWAPWYRGDEGNQPAAGVSYQLQDVAYLVDGKKKLLQDLCFAIPAGATVAVMGASGSGKTTLLSVLSGRCGDERFAGRLSLNGRPKQPSQMAELRPLIGYVPQDDVMHMSLTVAENIEFQATLRGDQSQRSASSNAISVSAFSAPAGSLEQEAKSVAQARKQRVADVISALGLAANSHRIVGEGLSGGQRKRVSIGMEVVASPKVLLLDEPTTGLDSSTSHRIMDMVLSNAQSEGTTTLATIHQPRWHTLALFEMLVLLAPGGYLCYAGPVAALQGYFQEVLQIDFQDDENPADTIIDACTFESAQRMVVEGVWRSPPQCLRAVLLPTPEAATEEGEGMMPWQQEEFGKMLSSLWTDFSTIREETLGGSSASSSLRPQSISQDCPWGAEAKRRALGTQWGEQVWVHLSRSLLVLSRDLFPAIAMNTVVQMIALVALAWATAKTSFQHVFLQFGLMFLLLVLGQSVSAQRIFGGQERDVAQREASVSSLLQVVYTFIGKDMATIVEIVLAAAVFMLTIGPLAHSFHSAFDMLEVGFAMVYCAWGLNHILAITFPGNVSMLVAVILCFISFLLAGLKPEAELISSALDGYGSLLLLASPIRWGLCVWTYRQVTGHGSTYVNDFITELVAPQFREFGFSMDEDITTLFPSVANIRTRWSNSSGWVSGTGQILLLGLMFRVLALLCFLISSSASASGGQLSLGATSVSKSRVMTDCLRMFILFMTLFQVLLLGYTY